MRHYEVLTFLNCCVWQ